MQVRSKSPGASHRRVSGGVARLVFLAMIGVILYVVASTSGAGWLYVVCAGLGGVVGISLISPLWNVRGLEVSRMAPRIRTVGRPLECALLVRNTKRLPKFVISASDDFAGGTGHVVIPKVRARGVVEVAYTVPDPKRGIYSSGEVTVESGAPFGLLSGRRRVRATSETIIHPITFGIAGLPLASKREEIGEESVAATMRRGLGGDFRGVREYRPGDPARLIAWKRSARSLASEKLSVVELAQQTSPPLTVALDLDAAAPEDAREMVISAAVSLMLQAIRENRDVIAEAGPGQIPFPEAPDAEAVLDWCAGLTATDKSPEGRFDVRVVPSLRKVVATEPTDATVVLVSCHSFAGDGDWMMPAEERSFLSRTEVGGGRVSWLGRDVPQPWRLS